MTTIGGQHCIVFDSDVVRVKAKFFLGEGKDSSMLAMVCLVYMGLTSVASLKFSRNLARNPANHAHKTVRWDFVGTDKIGVYGNCQMAKMDERSVTTTSDLQLICPTPLQECRSDATRLAVVRTTRPVEVL
jgi:hypothetical protein